MKFAVLTTLFTALCAPGVLSVPLEARNTSSIIGGNSNRGGGRGITDIDVLQFALTVSFLPDVDASDESITNSILA